MAKLTAGLLCSLWEKEPLRVLSLSLSPLSVYLFILGSFETESHYIAQVGLELLIFLSRPLSLFSCFLWDNLLFLSITFVSSICLNFNGFSKI
jgi:hypothetical protein